MGPFTSVLMGDRVLISSSKIPPSAVIEPPSQVLNFDGKLPRLRDSSMSLFIPPSRSRPISNLQDYMPPSASRSSWSDMPFSQFRHLMRLRQIEEDEQEREQERERKKMLIAAQHVPLSPDIGTKHLQAYLALLMSQINSNRALLDLPPWLVDQKNLSLMREICIEFWGNAMVRVPQVKPLEDGTKRYVVDYDATQREFDAEEELMEEKLFEISAKEQLARDAPNCQPAGESETMNRRTKPSFFIEVWANLGHIIAAKRTQASSTKRSQISKFWFRHPQAQRYRH